MLRVAEAGGGPPHAIIVESTPVASAARPGNAQRPMPCMLAGLLEQHKRAHPEGWAARRHKGNVSALLAEIASREAKFAAAEAFFEEYGVQPLDDEAVERIETEWRGEARKKRRRRAA